MEQKDGCIIDVTWGRILGWYELGIQEGVFRGDEKAYGVPRGGQPISALFTPVDVPEKAEIIVDDIVDSGATRWYYASEFPGKPFHAVISKKDDTWYRFPWEIGEEGGIEDNVRRIIQRFDDPEREGLKETPKRYVKFLEEFLSPPKFNFTTFASEGVDQMISVRDIRFYSLCEHHLAPFFGKGTIAYIPNNDIVVGISKLARTLEWYSRGFQTQERITKQVAERLMKELNPLGVAVALEAEHLCMTMRGVRKPGAKTRTTHLTGVFRDEPSCRDEFLNSLSW